MAKIDLSKMKLEELKYLQKVVNVAIRDFSERTRKEALAAAETAATERGFSLGELMGGKAAGKRGRTASSPKFRHPENPSMTWSGRGRKPAWFTDAIAAGVPEDKLRIARS